MRQMNPNAGKGTSRVNYRLQRLLLAKSFTFFLRIFAPVAGVAGVAAGLFAWGGFELRLDDIMSQVRKEVKYNPEFMIGGVIFQGASPLTEKEIRALLPARFPVSPFDIDVKQLKQEVEKLPAAASASVSMNTSGYMEIVVIEHAPALIWRSELDLHLLDSEGRVIGGAERRLDYPELTLVAGPGSDAARARGSSNHVDGAADRKDGPRLGARGRAAMGRRAGPVAENHASGGRAGGGLGQTHLSQQDRRHSVQSNFGHRFAEPRAHDGPAGRKRNRTGWDARQLAHGMIR